MGAGGGAEPPESHAPHFHHWAYGFSPSHIISRKLRTVGSAEHYYRKLASLILLLHSEFTSSLRRAQRDRRLTVSIRYLYNYNEPLYNAEQRLRL